MKTLDEIKKLMAAGETVQANEALKEHLAKDPENLQAKMLYGMCCQLLGDEESFRRIYDEVAPKMERLRPSEQGAETISLWKKYRTLWKSLIVGGLVLAGTAVAVVYFGRTTNQQTMATTMAVLYGGRQYFDNVKQPDDSKSSEKQIDVNRNKKFDD